MKPTLIINGTVISATSSLKENLLIENGEDLS